MLQSMTAFSRIDSKDEYGTFTWEIRSVNHRYLEPTFRLPETMRELEPQLRDLIRKNLNRGKVECSLKVQLINNQNDTLNINETLGKQVIEAAKLIKDRLGDSGAMIDPLQVLQWPGILQDTTTDAKTIQNTAITLFKSALSQMKESRSREGSELQQYIEQRADSIEKIVAEVRVMLPMILEKQKQKIIDRLAVIKADLDADRVEQEMVMLAQKSDVDEELDRLNTHIVEVRRILKQKGPVGRRLDFLMQELNREANTLSSKSIVSDTTQAAVELKVLIEQMREQIQNIE